MDVELARQQWQEGSRRLEAGADRSGPIRAPPPARSSSWSPISAAGSGQTFTLEELAGAYAGADDWARALLFDAAPEDAPPPEAALAADAAFHLYARGASDYSP